MRINFQRLSEKLALCGFERALANEHVIGSCMFVRPDPRPRLYQQIRVECLCRLGKGTHAAAADLAVTVVRWNTPWRVPLSEERPLKEIASNAPAPPPWNIGHWDTDIKTRGDAKAWEELLARLGPPAAAEFAAQTGPVVLERTETIRQLASRALAKLDPSVGVEVQIERLRRAMGESLAKQAEMALGSLGYALRGVGEINRLARLAVATEDEFSDAITMATRPLLDPQLNWPICLVADAIVSWDLHETRELRADLRFLGRKYHGENS